MQEEKLRGVALAAQGCLHDARPNCAAQPIEGMWIEVSGRAHAISACGVMQRTANAGPAGMPLNFLFVFQAAVLVMSAGEPPLCAGALESTSSPLFLSLLPPHLLAEVDRYIAINTWRPGVALVTVNNLPKVFHFGRRFMLEWRGATRTLRNEKNHTHPRAWHLLAEDCNNHWHLRNFRAGATRFASWRPATHPRYLRSIGSCTLWPWP